MSIEILGIAHVKPLDGMDNDRFQRIVNQVLSRAARSGQHHRSTVGMNVSDLASRYMAVCTKSAPLTPKEMALLNKDRPADQVIASYNGPQDSVRATFAKAKSVSK